MTLYFSYHIFYGARSYGYLQTLDREIAMKEQELKTVRRDRELLEVKVRLMRPGMIGKDMLEEVAQSVLGYHHRQDIVILRH